MAQTAKIIRNFYRDSVALMQLSARIAKLPGVRQASAIMASANNQALLREAGLLQGSIEASPNDLLIALEGDNEKALAAALGDAEEVLNEQPGSSTADDARTEPVRSLEMGLAQMPAANLALISTPGDYAAAEAFKALRLGLNVMVFSDNVTSADEAALKRYAQAHDLLVMGPDCGTAIVNGIPLGFANAVRRGDIGLVGASGTGLQQVTSLIDRLGGGVSQALGTGGHDLSEKVGGITMLQGLAALAADADTRAIILISKPPARDIAERVLAKARTCGKPVIVNFLGADPTTIAAPGITPAKTLEDAAVVAMRRATDQKADSAQFFADAIDPPAFAREQRYVRGLFSGGTLCYEATMLLSEVFPDVYSNTPVGAARSVDDVWHSRAHTLVDLGEDVFTRGRPHPMIDHRLRNERIALEAQDPQTAIILLDVVLGYGSHPDPAGAIAPVIKDAIAQAGAGGRKLVVIGSICGTAGDPQNLATQEEKLRQAGMYLAGSNAAAVRLAAGLLAKAQGH